MSTSVIDTGSLTKIFSPRRSSPVAALQGVDWQVGEGEIIGLLGPNGAGKTTLIDLLLGLTRPTSGSVRLFGTSPRQAIEDARVGAVLQTGGLLPDLTVATTVRMIAATYRDPLPVDEVLRAAELVELSNRKVSRCSGGEQQRIRFALALLGRPDLLILDEPTSGMDAGARHEFWEAMQRQANEGHTIIFATHYLAEAEDFARRIVMMHRGRIIADGTTEEIRAKTSTVTVEAWLPRSVAPERLPTVSDATELSATGESRHMRLNTTDSDELARILLAEFGASHLRIRASSLEDSFLALTGSQFGGADQPQQHVRDNNRRA